MRQLALLSIVAALAVLLGMSVFRATRRWTSGSSARSALLAGGAIIALVYVASAIPTMGDLEPPFSESPSGIFVLLGRVLAYGSLAIATIGALLGSTWGNRSG